MISPELYLEPVTNPYKPPADALTLTYPFQATIHVVYSPQRERTVFTKRVVTEGSQIRNDAQLANDSVAADTRFPPNGVARVPFPALLFFIGVRRGRVIGVGLARPYRQYTNLPVNRREIIRQPYGMFNMVRMNMVCFGSARYSVEKGLIDPIEAFWNTRFDAVSSVIPPAEVWRVGTLPMTIEKRARMMA